MSITIYLTKAKYNLVVARDIKNVECMIVCGNRQKYLLANCFQHLNKVFSVRRWKTIQHENVVRSIDWLFRRLYKSIPLSHSIIFYCKSLGWNFIQHLTSCFCLMDLDQLYWIYTIHFQSLFFFSCLTSLWRKMTVVLLFLR